MKAKEITEKLLWDENSIEWGERMIKDYARKKCEEQRELCFNQKLTKLTSTGISDNKEAVINAPEPNFE